MGLERAGMETVAFCEIKKFPGQILKKHWPDVPIFEDVRELHCDDCGNLFKIDKEGGVWVLDETQDMT